MYLPSRDPEVEALTRPPRTGNENIYSRHEVVTHFSGLPQHQPRLQPGFDKTSIQSAPENRSSLRLAKLLVVPTPLCLGDPYDSDGPAWIGWCEVQICVAHFLCKVRGRGL
jgi:hypothetical protein